jgi:hypothetical protein
MWFWQRWAVVLYGILAVASVSLDIVAAAPVVHQVTIVFAAAIVFLLVYLNRQGFRHTPGDGRSDTE